jgi:tight adherence protein C
MIPTEYLVPILAFVAVIAIGAGILLARALRRDSRRTPLVAESERPSTKTTTATEAGAVGMAGRLGEMVGVSKSSKGIRKLLARAGYQGDSAIAVFMGSKVILLAIAIAILGVLSLPLAWSGPIKIFVILLGASTAFYIPNFFVRMKCNSRELQIRRNLPDAVDLLEICVSGGMGIDQAWNVVTDEISSVSMLLGDEMAFTNLEIHLGASRSQAMRHMGERTGCQEASSLAAALTQSEHFGTSIGETLRVFAGSMREQRSNLAAETAEKMAVKLLFPLIFLIFPAIFVVVVGPSGIELIRLMAK